MEHTEIHCKSIHPSAPFTFCQVNNRAAVLLLPVYYTQGGEKCLIGKPLKASGYTGFYLGIGIYGGE